MFEWGWEDKCMCECRCYPGQKRAPDSLEPELQAVVGHLTGFWELRPSSE